MTRTVSQSGICTLVVAIGIAAGSAVSPISAEHITSVQGSQAVAPVEGQALASSLRSVTAVTVRGIQAGDFSKLAANVILQQGTMEGFDEGMSVAIGTQLAEQLSLRLGDTVTLVTSHGTTATNNPRIKAYTICAVFDTGVASYDSAVVFIPLAEALAFLRR